MISVRELSKRYGETVAIGGISFEVQPREVMGFLGPNGAGKSTTLRILSGYLAPSAGTAVLAGRDVLAESLEVRRRIGYLPENNPLYEETEVAEYLEWTAQLRGFRGPASTARVRRAVEACALGEALARPIGLLSKGFRQRVGLAAAILHEPEILLLDEPTSGLDPNQSAEVRALIQRLKREKTVLLSTHILSEVEASCDRVVILHRGRIAASGTPSELVARGSRAPLVRAAFKRDGAEPESLLRGLRALPGVRSADLREADGELRVSLAPEDGARDLRESVFRFAAGGPWVLLGLERAVASLESVFRELTPAQAPPAAESPAASAPRGPEATPRDGAAKDAGNPEAPR